MSTLFQDWQEELLQDVPQVDRAQVGQLLSCCFALLSPEAAALSIPDFPASSLPALVKLLVSRQRTRRRAVRVGLPCGRQALGR